MSCPRTFPASFRVALASARVCLALLLLISASVHAGAQSQALNGQIEGTITDPSGAALPAVTVTLVNVDNGTERVVTADEDGTYRAPLLPLGTYRITAESPNFKRLIREGITLTTGQTATVNLTLETGGVEETVTISGDAPIADAARIDLGRVINQREVENLPLVSRNPYNFGLLQANVTGRPNAEFGVPRINANGYARRANYQLDGNNNTQTDRAGIRLMPISETFVSEVQLVTNGFSAEFGNTPGIIFNTVTPTGTNDIRGSIAYRARRPSFFARPFFFNSPRDLPDTRGDNFSATVGGPFIKDRWQYYTGYEFVDRDLTYESARIVTIGEANRARLIGEGGVPAAALVPVIPVSQRVNFFIFRTDAQLTDAHRLVARYNLFRNNSPDNIGGGINTLQRSIDFVDSSDSVGVQLISTFTPNVLNEFRYQYAQRESNFLRNANSGTGPSIVISGIAQFGSPEDDDTLSPLEISSQVIDNVTYTRGDHTVKFGFGVNRVTNERRSNVFARYTFSNITDFINARSGTNPRSYATYIESFGDPAINYGAYYYQGFVQDDWKATPRLKINYGLRYDLYDVPQADSSAPLESQRNFRIDKNNFSPRLGIVYGLREGARPTVVRASGGLYYEPPFLDIYRRAIQNNGNPRFFNFTLQGTAAGAPAFPNTLGNPPAGFVLPRQSVEAVDTNYRNLLAYHANLQVEQALSQNLSVTVGYIFSRGTHLPVYRNTNVINPVSTLADGRPVFSTVVSAATRVDPRFNNILTVESVGTSDYNAGIVTLNKRFARGYQFSVNYTYSHAIDDAPEQNLVAVTNFALSDPTNRLRDRGNSVADQRHTFVTSFVGRPTFQTENRFLRRLVNDNQLGFFVIANSGETFNILSSRDLNADGQTSDRPLFVGRNTGNTPNQFNVDLRYSRFVTFSERFRLEVFGEFANLFNRRSIFQANNNTVSTNVSGTIDINGGALPNFFDTSRGTPVALDSRQFQLGFKFNF